MYFSHMQMETLRKGFKNLLKGGKGRHKSSTAEHEQEADIPEDGDETSIAGGEPDDDVEDDNYDVVSEHTCTDSMITSIMYMYMYNTLYIKVYIFFTHTCTVFARSDTVANIYFVHQFVRLLFKSSDYSRAVFISLSRSLC